MSADLVAHIEDWVRAGCPTPEHLRLWATEVYKALCADAIGQFAPREEVDARNALRAPVSASSFKSCERQVWYSARGTEGAEVAPRARSTWALGNQVEALAVYQMIASGLPVVAPGPDGKQASRALTVGEHEIPGHCDVLLDYGSHGVVPVEVKGLNHFTFGGWEKNGPDNNWGYLSQLNVYMAALGVERGFFYAINKMQGVAKCWEVQRDDLLVEWIKDTYLLSMEDEAPERPKWAGLKEMPRAKMPDGTVGVEELADKQCSYCSYREACFPGLETVIVSGQPKYRRALKE